jgi:alcohol dehydrogenase
MHSNAFESFDPQQIDFQHQTRLIYGSGTIERLGELGRQLGARRVLMVSDAGVVGAGHFQRASESLRRSGLELEAFLDVHENPSTVDVEAGRQVADRFQPDLLVGLGGGSAMDCAKGINFLHSCGGKMEDYWGVNKAGREMLPMIAIPTTAGTGSEAQSFALISHAETGRKMACGDRKAACRIAILDPVLTLTQPQRVTALTGIDAISHALESYVCNRRNFLSACYSRYAWQLLLNGFQQVLNDPGDVEAHGRVQLGAFFAGLAIETSMLGAAHALANPLTARFGVTHGQAVGMMLPVVIQFNSQMVSRWYDELWQDAAPSVLGARCAQDNHSMISCQSADLLAEFVRRLVTRAGLETDLESLGVKEDSLDLLALEATQQWTGQFNPRPLSQADFYTMYLQTLSCVKSTD